MIHWISAGFSAFIFLVVIEFVRREKMTFKYAFVWLGVSLAALVCAVFEAIPFAVARFFGFELTSNFVFFTLLSAFVLLTLLLTVFLCQQNSRNDAIAQKLAYLEFEIEELKKKYDR
jgi:hypothetical protein